MDSEQEKSIEQGTTEANQLQKKITDLLGEIADDEISSKKLEEIRKKITKVVGKQYSRIEMVGYMYGKVVIDFVPLAIRVKIKMDKLEENKEE